MQQQQSTGESIGQRGAIPSRVFVEQCRHIRHITGLDAGTYTLTVTDDLGEQVVVDAVVIDVPEIQVPVFAWNSQTMDVGEVLISVAGLHACPGQCNGGYAWSNYAFTPNLEQPLSYFPVRDGGLLENPIFTGYCATDVPTLQIPDGSGCTGTFPITGLIEAIAALEFEPGGMQTGRHRDRGVLHCDR